MVSPNLVKRLDSEKKPELNDNAKRLFQTIYKQQNLSEETEKDIPKIRVSSLISRLAFFYEKVRNAVDYEEEHLLRKNAIARILRRQILIEGVLKGSDSLKISEHLLVELIRGSYLSNNSVPEAKIQELALMLDKYIYLKNEINSRLNSELNLKTDINKAKDLINKKNNLIHWLISLAACEIEDNLAPDPVNRVIVHNLFSTLSANISLSETAAKEINLDLQLYLSISRKFLKFDSDMLGFVLFKYYNSGWVELNDRRLTEEDLAKIKEIGLNFENIKNLIDNQIKQPIRKQLDRIVRPYALYATILAETIAQNPTEIYRKMQKDENNFVAAIRQVCEKKYKKARHRLWRAAIRSIIYIFLTKSIFVLLIEVPSIKFFGEPMNYSTLAINISFPVVLLFIIVALTRKPGKENTDKIVSGIEDLTFVGRGRKRPLVIRKPARRGWLRDGIYKLIYGAAFVVSIYYIIKLLTLIDFTWVSVIIFLFFLALVSFFSIRTTAEVKELIVLDRRENILTFLLDLFYMPIILAGRWLSESFSKINIFIFFFDFIIESPFKVLMEIADDWTKYVRERRDNL